MKGLRIKQKSGKSFIDLEPTDDNHVRQNSLLVSVNEWSGEGSKVCNVYLNIEQIHELHEYLRGILKERNEILENYKKKIKERKRLLRDVYQASKDSGLVTHEQINNLSAIGAPVISLFARDLHVPASEIEVIAKNSPLPFALLNKHFKACWESVLAEPIPLDITV